MFAVDRQTPRGPCHQPCEPQQQLLSNRALGHLRLTGRRSGRFPQRGDIISVRRNYAAGSIASTVLRLVVRSTRITCSHQGGHLLIQISFCSCRCWEPCSHAYISNKASVHLAKYFNQTNILRLWSLFRHLK